MPGQEKNLLLSATNSDHNPVPDSCQGCGTCCRKGGPSFHRIDKELIDKGRIKTTDIYTIREGEPVFDNVNGTHIIADTDIIKIKGTQHSWTCILLESESNVCQIYQDRPLECRALKCWDTRDIRAIYSSDRLTRRDLLSTVAGLWEFIEDHQQECSYHTIRRLLEEGKGELEGEAKESVLEMIKYDLVVRPMIIEKGKLDPGITDFLLGRPLIETMSLFGLDIVKEGNGYHFQPRHKIG